MDHVILLFIVTIIACVVSGIGFWRDWFIVCFVGYIIANTTFLTMVYLVAIK